MTPQNIRRSGRIAQEIAILLIGSDTEGKVFSEETKAVVLSRHGAGLISRHNLVAEEEVIIRTIGNGKEAQARVVGRLGSEGSFTTYGVAFIDDSLQFWDIDFPPLPASERPSAALSLVCSICDEHAAVVLSELESDVYTVNDGIIRYCTSCGYSTIWKRGASSEAKPPKPATAHVPPPVAIPSAVPALAQAAAEAPSSYSGTAIAEFSDFSYLPEPKRAAAPTLPVTNAPGVNRRKYVRARVTVAACIRSAGFGDDVAICEDMSRGGIRFKSRKQYLEGDSIEVAAPFSPETQSIFVTAKIVFVQKIADQDFFRCGVVYLPLSDRKKNFS
jgi:PilZ domain